MTRKTPLYERHVELGGKVVDFAGYKLPVQFAGIIEEHKAVRNDVGIFDVSHMGEFEFRGPQALEAVQKLIANNAAKLEINQVLYTPMCYPDGGVVDDLLVYRLDKDRFLFVVNAANLEKDWDWVQENTKEFDVEIENQSFETGQVALQGPKAQELLQKIYDRDLGQIKFFWLEKEGKISGKDCIVSRTGYTGEDGFEIYARNEDLVDIFDAIWDAGKEFNLQPCGLGARDTLRFEAALPLYGHELSQDINPFEARLKIFVDLEKGDFIGRDALVEVSEKGVEKRIAGIEMKDKGIPRQGYPVEVDGEEVGFVTSGTFSPTLGKNLGIVMVKKEFAKAGSNLDIRIRKRLLGAEVVKLPFYKRR